VFVSKRELEYRNSSKKNANLTHVNKFHIFTSALTSRTFVLTLSLYQCLTRFVGFCYVPPACRYAWVNDR